MRLDKRLDDGFFLALPFNGEADSSESDESSYSDDGGDGALALAILADALFFLVPPGFALLANGEADDSSESDDRINTADSSESEEGGDGAIAFFALAFLALRLDGASSASSAADWGHRCQ